MKDGLWFVFVDVVVVVDVVVALRGCSFSVSKAVLGKLLRLRWGGAHNYRLFLSA